MQVSTDGETLWRARVGGAVRGGPLVLPDGSTVVSANDQALHRFDAQGRRIYRVPLVEQGGQPAWLRGHVSVAAGEQLSLVSGSGALRRITSLVQRIQAGPSIADDGTLWVIATSEAGGEPSLAQVSPEGAVRTRTSLPELAGQASLAIGVDGAVRVPTSDGIVAIGPSGTKRWEVLGEGRFTGGLIVDRDNVTVGVNNRGVLLAISPDGHVRWRVETERTGEAPPVIGRDGTIYLASARGLQAWK
jgi:outer membrane protein assembly factor BamB